VVIMGIKKDKIETIGNSEFLHHRVRKEIGEDVKSLLEATTTAIENIVEKRGIDPSRGDVDYIRAVLLGFMNCQMQKLVLKSNMTQLTKLPYNDQQVQNATLIMFMDWKKFMATMINVETYVENNTVEKAMKEEKNPFA
ncbi:MAG: hypothetical protein M1491_02285, partial [Deltaproteobacteria bacterium]|nr:hypothetical protein [Deltaproteobacteria bacterium]